MTQPYIGQIQPYAFNFAPKSWAFCNGQILPIAQNQAQISLSWTTMDEDGRRLGAGGRTRTADPALMRRML